MTTLVLALFLPASAAAMAPIVWFHVPDGATQRVETADMTLSPGRHKVELAEHAIVETKGERQDLLSRRRDAREDRHDARVALRDSCKDLRKARHSGTEATIARRTEDRIAAKDNFEGAQKHIAWHNGLLRENRADLRVDQARRSRAASGLEMEQSVLLHEHGYRFVYGPSTFEKQVERMDRKILARESDLTIASREASELRLDYVAAN